MTLVPMFADYKSLREVRNAFHSGRDFRIMDISSRWDGKPVNKPQLVAEGVQKVFVRYAGLRRIAAIDVNEAWPKPERIKLASPDPEK